MAVPGWLWVGSRGRGEQLLVWALLAPPGHSKMGLHWEWEGDSGRTMGGHKCS